MAEYPETEQSGNRTTGIGYGGDAAGPSRLAT